MDILVERCAGLDVHRDTVVATVRVPPDSSGRKRRAQYTQSFATTTAGITKLGDWLAEHRVTRAGIESTGVYWKTGLLPARRPARGVADQRRAPAQRARPQDRRGRLGVDRADGRARPGPAQFRAPAADPRAA